MRSTGLLCRHSQVLDGQARRQRLLQLVGLFGVMDDQCVQVATASHLELDVRLRLHDLDGLGILPARRQEEVFDLVNLFRHDEEKALEPS